jgi:CDP-glucose 4,6-dehydratase
LHSSNEIKFEDAFNFSNPQNFGISVGKLLSYIPAEIGLRLELDNNAKFPEAKFLNLNSEKAEAMLNWQAKIEVARAMKLTMEWYEKYLGGSDMRIETISQIRDFLKNEAC